MNHAVYQKYIMLTPIKRKRKRNKRHSIGKKEVKLSLFTDNRILYTGDPMKSAKNTLELLMSPAKVEDMRSLY